MRALLDVNTLVALAWPNHVHHRTAADWFRENRDGGWATCPPTEAGFVRVSANPRIGGGAVTVPSAIDLLAGLRRLGDHTFWEDRISIAASEEVPRDRFTGYRQVTDAHLVALCRSHGGTLVTFDQGVLELVPGGEGITLLRQ